MVHIFIFVQIVALFSGAAIIFGIRRLGKPSPDPFFNPLIAYAGFSTAGVLLSVLSNYLNANIENFKGDFSATVWTAAGFVLTGGSILALLAFLFRLRGRKTPAWVIAAAITFLSAVGILHLAGIFNYQVNASIVHICPYRGVMLVPLIVIMAGLVAFLIAAGEGPSPGGGKRVIVRFLVGYAILALLWISTWNPDPLNAVIRIGLLGVAYGWYRAYKCAALPRTVPDIEGMIQMMGETYGLSKREKEVLALLLGGKKNREIEASLFLSSSTVRNHISSLYGKIGIDSRGQLTGLALSLRKTPSGYPSTD